MNKGAVAHRAVDGAALWYRSRGLALVTFAGPQWVDTRPVRNRPGRFEGIQKRGPVDYVGHDAKGRGFRFDLKASHERVSVDLSLAHVPEHQREELAWCARCGVPAGLLVAQFQATHGAFLGWYWLPAPMLVDLNWARVKWATMKELGLGVPLIRAPGGMPDFLDTILGS